MFSYRLGTYGGAVFLIPYFLFVFLLGTTGLIAEFTFGRTFRSGSMVGIRKVFKSSKLKRFIFNSFYSSFRSNRYIRILFYSNWMDFKVLFTKYNWRDKKYISNLF